MGLRTPTLAMFNSRTANKSAAPAVPKPINAPMAPPQEAYKAQLSTGPLPEFEKQKQIAQQRLGASGQQQNEALQRRFAQMGGGPSGASIKAQQNLGANLLQQQEDTLGGIDAAQLQEQQRRNEMEQGKAFSSQEALAGRQFQSGEALAGRQFGAEQSALDRAIQAEQFGKQFGLSKQANTREEEAQKFNLALAQSDLSGGKLDRFNQAYMNPAVYRKQQQAQAAQVQAQRQNQGFQKEKFTLPGQSGGVF